MAATCCLREVLSGARLPAAAASGADVDDYLRTLRYVKPAWVPRGVRRQRGRRLSRRLRLLPRHEQHLCMPIVEITSRCDLACPACLVDAGRPWDMSRAELGRMLDGLIAAERQIDVLNLSGGEPLVHPDLLGLVDEALRRPEIVRVSISTNGLALWPGRRLVDRLRERNVVVSLQFDGFRDETYEVLRGRPLLAEKLRVLDLLRQAGISTSLTMTVGRRRERRPVPRRARLLLLPAARGQPDDPAAGALPGAGRRLRGQVARGSTHPRDRQPCWQPAGRPEIRADDFQPLPCSHPLCFSLAFYLMLDGGGVGLAQPAGRSAAVARYPGQPHDLRPGRRGARADEGHDLRPLERSGRRRPRIPSAVMQDAPPAAGRDGGASGSIAGRRSSAPSGGSSRSSSMPSRTRRPSIWPGCGAAATAIRSPTAR